MHLIASIPGGWNPDDEGVFHVEQTPGDIIFLSAADTELLSLQKAYQFLHQNQTHLPSLRLANLIYFKQELTIDTYLEEVVEKSKLVILRLLGGKAYFNYLIEAFKTIGEDKNIPILFLPGYDTPDLALMNESTVDFEIVHQVWQYFTAGGKQNLQNCLQYLMQYFFDIESQYTTIQKIPDLFLYEKYFQKETVFLDHTPSQNVLIIAYRSHYLADNLAPIHAIADKLQENGLNPLIIFAHTLRDESISEDIYQLLQKSGIREINLVINTTSFSIKNFEEKKLNSFIFKQLDVPVLQAILGSITQESWKEGSFGLSPTDIAMNIALPEVDGRIITKPISFKRKLDRDTLTDTDLVYYHPHEKGCDFVVNLSKNYIKLQQKTNDQKRIALILPNYPNKDSRLANGVGLDTPESAVQILKKLKEKGYTLENVPQSSEELIHTLTQHITNETDTIDYRKYQVSLSQADFEKYEQNIPSDLLSKVKKQWGEPYQDPYFINNSFVFSGFVSGNIFISIQPSRGYHIDPQSTYHSPDLPPPYYYMAYYHWLQNHFQADAIIHLGKHGNLEWLPGKSVALDNESCFPAHILGAIPHFYPFIVNDPGEGTQAKRRNQAVIIDHLIPPMTRAEIYGDLLELENLIDEYYQAVNLDAKRVNLLKENIQNLVQKTQLKTDLAIEDNDIDELLVGIDSYLCEIKEAQIRDGLHILGKSPENEQLIDLLIALHRMSGFDYMGITQALAKDLGLAFNPINADYKQKITTAEFTNPTSWKNLSNILNMPTPSLRNVGDIVAYLEDCVKKYLTLSLYKQNFSTTIFPNLEQTVRYIFQHTLPKILNTNQELEALLQGLNGKYIPSGPSGAPTRGRLDILPTGRNFYSVDTRSIPTETAYSLGYKSANLLIERYMQENGDYPKHIALSVWGTATMRTGGDDLAQAFALLGVKPLWNKTSRRVHDFEVIPLLKLGRPRVDVTLRISGFFRDAFPDMISLFNTVIKRIALLDESSDDNPTRACFLEEKGTWIEKGISEEIAEERALYRVFGSKPGAYGAGLQTLIDEKTWETRQDLAQAYIQWSAYAYTEKSKGKSAYEPFVKRLQNTQVILQNQDNREHDILDSDDYYQFQGGLSSAVETIKGEQASIYFGDNARPDNPKIKSLKEELLKVYRSRVINPKWIQGVKRHGYKGAFEMAATMDYLFAYDATTELIEDFMYEGITQAYLLDENTQNFIKEVNPWALQDMSERMLEAIQRGMWQNPDEEIVEKLKNVYLQADTTLEEI